MSRQQKTINIEVGARIKECRRGKGLTRETLAGLSGYSVNFIQEVERGRSGLSSESMRSFSKALGVSADYLLFGESNDDFRFVGELLKTVPAEKRDNVLRIIKEAVELAL